MEGGRRGTEDSGQRTATQDSAPPLPGAEVSGTPLTNDPTRPADTSLQLGALLDSSVVDCSGVQLGSESFCYVDTTSPCNFYPLSQPLPSTINTEYLHCLIQKITFQILLQEQDSPNCPSLQLIPHATPQAHAFIPAASLPPIGVTVTWTQPCSLPHHRRAHSGTWI